MLIDGRNRLRACEIANVEPTFQQLNGHDADAFIVSANLARRNLTKGQQAMALAMIYQEADKRGRGNKGKSAETSDFSQKRLSQARAVLRHSRALAEDVLADRKKLDQAEFVGWWDNRVRAAHRPGTVTDRVTVTSRDDAEAQTGITRMQVSRWRKHLANRAKYREQMILAAYRKADLSPAENHRSEGPGEPCILDLMPSGGSTTNAVQVSQSTRRWRSFVLVLPMSRTWWTMNA